MKQYTFRGNGISSFLTVNEDELASRLLDDEKNYRRLAMQDIYIHHIDEFMPEGETDVTEYVNSLTTDELIDLTGKVNDMELTSTKEF